LAEDPAKLMRASAGLAHEAGGVRIVYTQQGAELIAQGPHPVELRNGSVHRKHTIREHEDMSRALRCRLLELAPQIVHVVVTVTVARRLG